MLLWAIPVVGILLVAVILWRFIEPPISVVSSNGAVEIDVRSLGEYNSSLSKIEIFDRTAGRVIWRAVAGDEAIEVFTLIIRAGENPSDLGLKRQDARVQIDLPAEGDVVHFADGHKFDIRIFAKLILPFGIVPSSTASFTLAARG